MKNMSVLCPIAGSAVPSLVKAGAQVVTDNVKDELFITIGNDVGASAGRMLQSYLQPVGSEPVAPAAPAGPQPRRKLRSEPLGFPQVSR